MSQLGRVGRWQLKLAGCHKISSFFSEGFPKTRYNDEGLGTTSKKKNCGFSDIVQKGGEGSGKR